MSGTVTALGATEDDEESSRLPAVALPVLALLTPVAGQQLLGGDGAAYVLIGIPLVIAAITSRHRMRWEEALERRDIPEREAWLPAVYLGLGAALQVFGGGLIIRVASEKIGIISFILAFALVSEGLSRSGLFHFLAFRIAERCDGSTSRLILYLFVLASMLTAVTSNDIVVLSLTPIVLSICHQARIPNVRLIMLSTFIAANTLSMALLIGSPTNIILSQAIGLNGFSYTFLMLVPSALGFLATYVVASRIVTSAHVAGGGRRRAWQILLPQDRWTYRETYSVPQFTEYQTVTRRMLRWMWLFGVSVALLMVVSFIEVSLLWSAVPIAVGALVLSSHDRGAGPTGRRTLSGEVRSSLSLLRAMPWGILFFGITFFVVAAAFGETAFFREQVVGFLDGTIASGGPFAGVVALLGTGVAVNLFNDLPAAALMAEALPRLSFETSLNQSLATVGVLAGLNIGTYVTPTGALAGLIWFRVMRRESDRLADNDSPSHLLTPNRSDLVRFGLTVFLPVAILLGVMSYGVIGALSYLLSDSKRPSLLVDSPGAAMMTFVGLTLCAAVIVWFRRELRRQDVVLAHMRDAFTFLNRLRAWSLRHPISYAAAVAAAVLIVAASLLFWAESYHASLYGVPAKFNSAKEFVPWLVAFIGSGYENDLFPSSLFGIFLSGLLPLLGIAVIIQLIRAPGSAARNRLRLKLAQGDARINRTVVIGRRHLDRVVVDLLLEHTNRFVVLLAEDAEDDEAEASEDYEGRTFVARLDGDTSAVVERFGLLDADEILLLTDGLPETDFRNLRVLGALDDAAQLRFGGESTRLPRILLECSSDEMESLLHRSISHELGHRVVITNVGRSVGDFFAADAAASIDVLERLYCLVDNDWESSSDLDVDALDSAAHLELIELPDMLGRGLQSYSADVHNRTDGSRRIHTAQLRQRLESTIEEAARADGGSLTPSALVGFEVGLGHGSCFLGMSSAALGSQVSTVRRAIVMTRGERDLEHRTPIGSAADSNADNAAAPVDVADDPVSLDPTTGHRVHVVNTSDAAISFVRSATSGSIAGVPTQTAQIIVHALESDSAPSELQRTPGVTVVDSEDESSLVERMTSPTSAHRLRPGDRVYVFSRVGAGLNADLLSLRFVRSLDVALARTGHIGGVDHASVYLAVESRDPTIRFLFEQLFVDKILDTAVLRENYFRNLLDVLFRLPIEQDVLMTGSFQEFEAAANYAERFRFLTVQPAKDPVGGAAVLTGMPFGEAAVAVRSRSDPPSQVLAVGEVTLERVGLGPLTVSVSLGFPDERSPLDGRGRLFLATLI